MAISSSEIPYTLRKSARLAIWSFFHSHPFYNSEQVSQRYREVTGETVLIPDLLAGCSLASSITGEDVRRLRQAYPGVPFVTYVNTSADVKAESDICCTSSNAVSVVEHIRREHGEDVEILFGPDMFLGAYVEKVVGRPMHVWNGECHVHAGIRPSDIDTVRAAHPGADFLIHPECGCSTSVMEYVAAGDIDTAGVHMLSTGGMLQYAKDSESAFDAGADRRTAIVATETGMLHPLRMAAPALGEHSRMILSEWLGYSDGEVDALYNEKIVL